jgi:hypothetical protein
MRISQFMSVGTIAVQWSVTIGSDAFETRNAIISPFGSISWNKRRRRWSSILPRSEGKSPSSSSSDDDTEPIDDSFYLDLKKAKAEKLGAEIPPEQLKESARGAENEFLQAMKQTTQDFEKAKETLGSEGAVELFLDNLRKEDERKGNLEREYVEEEEEPFQ